MVDLLVDTSVVLDLADAKSSWLEWSASALEKYDMEHKLLINPIIYAEVSIGFSTIEECERLVNICGFEMEAIPKEALFLAGKAFLSYRRERGASKLTALPDFFIGAHAAISGYGLITRDPKRIRTYFPTVNVIAPS